MINNIKIKDIDGIIKQIENAYVKRNNKNAIQQTISVL